MSSTILPQGADSAAEHAGREHTPHRAFAQVWGRRRLMVGAIVAMGAATGVASALIMPRGPMSAGDGLTIIILGLLLGAFAGLVIRQRRAVVWTVAAHVAMMELVRWPINGPTVDGIHLGSTYGLITFVTGRGFHGLLLVLPALLAAAYSAGLARRLSGTSPSGPHGVVLIRRVLAAVFALGLLGALVLIGQPPRTEPITGADGKPLAGSIAELGTMRVGGHDTTMMVRGNNSTAPVLLYLAGGPGGTDIGAMRLFGEPLEQDFVVATWDQRGAGASYQALDPTSTLTLNQAVSDTIDVARQLRARFGDKQIYLVGNSWGTIAGILAVQRRPDLFAAYVGAGQMVSPSVTDQMFYEDTLAWAHRTGAEGLARTLTSNGPPPYTDVLKYESALTHEHDWNAYAMAPGYAGKGELPANLFVPEYDLVQKVRGIDSFLDTFATLYPQLQDIDFRTQATTLRVPVYVVEGEHEARGRLVPARQWYDLLDAPGKQWITVPQAGHRPHFEQPARFAAVMRTVLADTR